MSQEDWGQLADEQEKKLATTVFLVQQILIYRQW